MRRKIQNPNLDKDWFDHELAKRKLSVRAVGRHLNVSSTMASLMLRGVAKIPQDKVPMLADLLGVTSAEIYRRTGATLDEDRRVLKVSYYITPEYQVCVLDPEQEFVIDAPFDTRLTAPAIQMRTGDQYDGWMVVASGIQLAAHEAVNKLCLYCNDEGQLYVAIIKAGYLPGTFNASSALANGVTVENVKIKWAMEINWIRPRTL